MVVIKKYLMWILLSSILIILLFVWRLGYVNNSNILNELINNDDCSMTCWLGIEPLVTSNKDARLVLASNEIVFNDVEGPWEDGYAIWEFPVDTHINNVSPSLITFSDNLVSQIIINVDICISDMLAEYGEPEDVVLTDGYYYFLYHNLGLFLSTSDRFGLDRVSTIFITNLNPITRFAEIGTILTWDEVNESLTLVC